MLPEVPRIGRAISLLFTVFSEAAGVVSIARIERSPLYRGGSASTETMPAVSLLPFRARSCSYFKRGASYNSRDPALFARRGTVDRASLSA